MKKYFFSFSIFVFILFINSSNIKCQNTPGSILKIFIYNNTLKWKVPIDIWFNDSLVISEKVSDSNYQITYKLFSKGNLRITTQIRGFEKTRTEYALNILNDKSYIIAIRFDDSNQSGTIFGLKKTDGVTYEPYFEENIFQLAKLDEGQIFAENGLIEENISHNYSVCHILLKDNFCTCPMRIWINDKIVMDQVVPSSTGGSSIYCKLFSEGKIKISAQLSAFETKMEKEFEISNNKIYYIKVNFPILETKSSIEMLDQEEGLKLLTKCKLFWTVAENISSNSVVLKENIENPIPSMIYSSDYLAFHEKIPIDDSLKIQDNGLLVDSRDGQIYKTITIGKQTWMAENLNFETEEGSQCFEDTSKCNKYGRFYDWETANKVCPSGWHLSSQYEWELLKEQLDVAKKDNATFDILVEGGSSGLNVLLAGGHHCPYNHACKDVGFGSSAYFWCSGIFKIGGVGFIITKGGKFGKTTGPERYYKASKLSVRCVKDGLPEDF